MKDPNHYKNMPRKRVHVAALIFYEVGNIVLVKPSYKEKWSLPGGSVDADESPRNACIREVQEETGLVVTEATFLCVQYVTDVEKGDALFFVFDCGVVNDSQLVSAFKKTEEIERCQFVAVNEIESYVPEGVAVRIKAGLGAKQGMSEGYVER